MRFGVFQHIVPGILLLSHQVRHPRSPEQSPTNSSDEDNFAAGRSWLAGQLKKQFTERLRKLLTAFYIGESFLAEDEVNW